MEWVTQEKAGTRASSPGSVLAPGLFGEGLQVVLLKPDIAEARES